MGFALVLPGIVRFLCLVRRFFCAQFGFMRVLERSFIPYSNPYTSLLMIV